MLSSQIPSPSQEGILVGDCRVRLPELPANSFHAVVTSPPYFRLRTYEGNDEDVNCATTNPEELESRLASAAMLHRESDGKIVVLIHGVGRERGLEILVALGLGPPQEKDYTC